MSKLFRLKEWVTIPEAAQHLSIVCGEAVAEADLLRFALQGQLTLSVYFVNHAKARCGLVVGLDEVEWRELPGVMTAALERVPESERGKPIRYIRSLPLDDEGNKFINLRDEVSTLDGVWDLPMIGGERLDVEHRLQYLIGGPAVTLSNLDGAFVKSNGNQICQLQESFNENAYQDGSTAQLAELRQHIAAKKISREEAEQLLRAHEAAREGFLERARSKPEKENYYPAPGLPPDSVLVVRPANLFAFVDQINGASPDDKPTGERERATLLTIIAALAREAKIDISRPSKAGALIENLTQQLGARVSKRAIEEHLKRIRDALEKRAEP